MVHRDNLDEIISDEEIRQRVRQMFGEPKQSKIDKLSRHPLATMFVGFLLTWGIGGILTGKISAYQLENQKKIEQVKVKREEGLKAIKEITELMYTRYTVSVLLASSLKRNAPLEELKERKNRYDDIYLKWNSSIQNTQFTIRGLMDDSAYSELESVLEFGLVAHFNNVDKVITNGYDMRLKRDSPVYDSLYIKKELAACLDCSYAISNYLWMRTNLYGNVKNNSIEFVKKIERELYETCM
ncbi:hypothetical protein TH61_16270 [Rufibacter sp. DG15C]|uniref:hypothetical protein n=1 Tax=Rufibacter sp. DG15C TaxID=1379909 RepID=UPI00078DDE0D|nr:hypothetical protein [Rufibacter sp. DG15C]AMM52432.1 hypothetical protein TH61_16270 [Rufibacter sp. DG15C]